MVGTRCIDVEDISRKEVLGDGKGNRRIVIRFYYPGKGDPDRKPCRLLTEDKVKAYVKKPDFREYDRKVKTYEDLEMRDGSFPLILFSHGYGFVAEQNSYLCQYLADHGYIVASISHSFEASETIFTDGTSIKRDKTLIKKMYKNLILGQVGELSLIKKNLKR